MKFKVVLLSMLFFLNTAYAETEGKRGFVLDVAVSGFFSPDVKSAKVISLELHSNAEKAGIEIGDELVAVYDCKIPGCVASKAKELMTKKTGEIIFLSFRRNDQSMYSVKLVLE
jgi:C-terminal processing protease CtpA/Prc